MPLFHMILDKLYKLNIKQYILYIDNILQSSWFQDGYSSGQIKIKFLSEYINEFGNNIYTTIISNDIEFSNKYLVMIFEFNNYHSKDRIKLLNINLKNQTIFNLLKLLVKKQSLFIGTLCYEDLIFHSREEIIKEYKLNYNSYIDSSIVSKIFKYVKVHINQTKFYISIFLPKKSFLIHIYIKNIIFHSEVPMTDSKLSDLINHKYNLKTNRKMIQYIRQKYFIPSAKINTYRYFHMHTNKFFSKKFLLSKESILNSVLKNSSGVYYLYTTYSHIYRFNHSSIVYIGSSKNLKNRLLYYVKSYGHNIKMKNLLRNNIIYIRYLKTNEYREYEKILLENFINLTGELPLVNKQHIIK